MHNYRAKPGMSHFTVYFPVYLLAISVIITALIGGKSTHPGFALGLATIVTSLLLLVKTFTTRGTSIIVYGYVLGVVVLLGLIAVAKFRDAGETWLTTCFSAFSILLILDMLIKSSLHRR